MGELVSVHVIPRPHATLEDVLVPVYLYHRYQVTAVAKSIGGMNYSFDLRGSVGKGPVPQAKVLKLCLPRNNARRFTQSCKRSHRRSLPSLSGCWP